MGYGWVAGNHSPIRQITPSISGFVFLRRGDGSIESAEFSQQTEIDLKSGASIDVEAEVAVEDLDETLEFDNGSFVPAGRYTFTGGRLSYRLSSGALFRGRVSASAGRFYDGRLIDVRINPTWTASKYVELGANTSANFVKFSARNQTFNFVVAGGRIQLAVNKQLSATVFVQYNSANKFTSTNVRLRYNFQEGQDLWLVYDEGNNWDRRREVPVLPVIDRRTLVLKYTHTFRN
jgi:hypothetical protein